MLDTINLSPLPTSKIHQHLLVAKREIMARYRFACLFLALAPCGCGAVWCSPNAYTHADHIENGQRSYWCNIDKCTHGACNCCPESTELASFDSYAATGDLSFMDHQCRYGKDANDQPVTCEWDEYYKPFCARDFPSTGPSRRAIMQVGDVGGDLPWRAEPGSTDVYWTCYAGRGIEFTITEASSWTSWPESGAFVSCSVDHSWIDGDPAMYYPLLLIRWDNSTGHLYVEKVESSNRRDPGSKLLHVRRTRRKAPNTDNALIWLDSHPLLSSRARHSRVFTGIPYRLFQGCSDLISLQTSGIRVIGVEAFSGSSLQDVDLDESVELIGYHAFPPSGWRDHPNHTLTRIKMPCLSSPDKVHLLPTRSRRGSAAISARTSSPTVCGRAAPATAATRVVLDMQVASCQCRERPGWYPMPASCTMGINQYVDADGVSRSCLSFDSPSTCRSTYPASPQSLPMCDAVEYADPDDCGKERDCLYTGQWNNMCAGARVSSPRAADLGSRSASFS